MERPVSRPQSPLSAARPNAVSVATPRRQPNRVTTRVECSEYFTQRDDALRAHATQIDPTGDFFTAPIEWQQRLWPTEEFELARSRVPVDLPETDLFAGIDQ